MAPAFFCLLRSLPRPRRLWPTDTYLGNWWSDNIMVEQHEANMSPGRSELDALTVPATNTTSVYNAFPTGRRAMPISPHRIHTASSNRTHFPSSTENGARTRNSCSWKAPRSTAWVPGRISPITLVVIETRTRSATITYKSTSTRRASPSRNDAARTTWN